MRALVIIASTILVAAIIVSSRPAAASQPVCGDGENETPCPAAYAWQTGDWSDWSGECGTVTRERPVWCSDADDPNSYWPEENCASEKPASVESEERWRCPIYEWTTTEWGDWSASCGEATRTRTAQCVDAADGNSERDASVCESAGIPAPELVETYTFEACAPAVWRYGEWGEWSATCGDVRRERPVWCVDATESTVDDAQCVAEDRPASEEYTSLNVCERYEWRIGGWGDWSGSCGTVTRTREVQCVDAADGGSERDAWRCELATGYTPESSEDGDLGSCVAPEWRTNEWGAWSATCTDANGADVTHSRTVWCENAFDGSLLGDDACDANARPWSEETAADAGYELPPCHHCALGQYAPPSRPTSCVACSVGRYSDTTTASACTRCAVGRFAATSGAVECTVCARGKYAPTVGRSACQTCAAGRYSDTEGASVCSSCAVGTASSIAGAETSEVCTACSPGFYAAIEGSRRCTACPSGWYTSEPGAAECSPCAVGSAASSAGSSSCKTCSRGRFAPELAASACQRCAIGRYASAEGGESCTACAPGHYAATEGRSSCSGCARGAFSAASGASTCTLCAPGTFLATSRGSSCNLCPAGRFAAAAGATACDVCASARAPGASTCDR